MSRVHEEIRVTYQFPVLGRVEISSIPKRKKAFFICGGWAAFLLSLFVAHGLLSYYGQGKNDANSVYPYDLRAITLRASEPAPRMVDGVFEKWSEAKLKSFEHRLQSLEKRAVLVQGKLVGHEKGQTIDHLKRMQAEAQICFGKLRTSEANQWNEARQEMIIALRDLQRAHNRAATRLTDSGF